MDRGTGRTGSGLSIEMEKVINLMSVGEEKVSAEKILEINKDHEVLDVIKKTFEPATSHRNPTMPKRMSKKARSQSRVRA